MKIVAVKSILKANDQLAEENRGRFNDAGIFCLNVVGSPGAGKTTLLEAILANCPDRSKAAVIEGDIAGSIDAERIEALGVAVVQINTGGACHLDANMISAAIDKLDCDGLKMLFIENVGNLVCTAGYDLGEHLRVAVLSVSEGDDKVVKYPAIFKGSQALFITKCDQLPGSNFDVQRVRDDMKRLAPKADVFEVTALSGKNIAGENNAGDGIAKVADWLAAKAGC